MDDFGVLVESIGFKSQRNSAPLANLKGKTNVNHGVNSGFNTKNSPFKGSELSDRSNSINTSFEDNLDGIFQAGSNTKTQNSGGFDVYDDVFGASFKNSKPPESKNVSGATSIFDLNSMFKGSGSSNVKSSVSGLYDGGDDIFGGISGFKSSASGYSDDVFGGMASQPPQSDAVDDLLGNFDGNGSNSSGLKRDPGSIEGNHSEFDDDLIPGFRGSSNSSPVSKSETSNFHHPNGYSTKSTSNLSEGPFSEGFFSDPMEQHSKGSIVSSIDELEDFARAKVRNDINIQSDVAGTKIGMPDAEKKEHKTKQKISQREQGNWVERRTGMEKIAPEFDSHLDSFFTSGNQSNSMPKAKSMAQDSMFDSLFQEQQPRKLERDSSEMSSRTMKISSVTNLVDNFSNLFGAPSYDDFQEIEGESKERRKARLNHHNRTQARMAKALAEKNERDFQAQQEQEERHRLGETFNHGVKRWAAGKEGNLRALLSSLQYVLWPESGWQPVSLTDLITTTAVKKVYHKATLYVHPDKVQQKGANLEQKYIAEKVFDLLKEAWSKFNTEELR